MAKDVLVLDLQLQNTSTEIFRAHLIYMISMTEFTSTLDYGHEFQKTSDIVGLRYINLRHVFNAVPWRPTSKPEDEVVCLATLLGVEPHQFLKTDPKQHSPRLSLELEKILISILSVPGERHRAANIP